MIETLRSIEAHNRNLVEAEMWGHLAPQPRKVYEGTITFAKSFNGDMLVIDFDFGDLDSSPWFYEGLYAHITGIKGLDDPGVWIFTGTYRFECCRFDWDPCGDGCNSPDDCTQGEWCGGFKNALPDLHEFDGNTTRIRLSACNPPMKET